MRVTFTNILHQIDYKTKFLLIYFNQALAIDYSKEDPRMICITRKVKSTKTMGTLFWENNNMPLIDPIIDNEKLIEDYPQDYMVDFANKYIGGGSFNHGNV